MHLGCNAAGSRCNNRAAPDLAGWGRPRLLKDKKAGDGRTGKTWSVYPEVRVYADPFEGLKVQLTELRGLIKIVRPLIDADRQRRWREISARPSDGEDGDVIDIYGDEAGPEEGYGFAEFDRTIRIAAVVFAWAVFQDYLAHELKRSCLDYDLSEYPALEKLVEEDVRKWDRRFDQISQRYRDFAGISLSDLSNWDEVLHAQELRNALVHNQGQYTRAYLKNKRAYRPTKEDLNGFTPPTDEAALIDREIIPLSCELADTVIMQLQAAATEVREAVDKTRRK